MTHKLLKPNEHLTQTPTLPAVGSVVRAEMLFNCAPSLDPPKCENITSAILGGVVTGISECKQPGAYLVYVEHVGDYPKPDITHPLVGYVPTWGCVGIWYEGKGADNLLPLDCISQGPTRYELSEALAELLDVTGHYSPCELKLQQARDYARCLLDEMESK
jgi:hypothetical protein